jgi:hypothetical protein
VDPSGLLADAIRAAGDAQPYDVLHGTDRDGRPPTPALLATTTSGVIIVNTAKQSFWHFSASPPSTIVRLIDWEQQPRAVISNDRGLPCVRVEWPTGIFTLNYCVLGDPASFVGTSPRKS